MADHENPEFVMSQVKLAAAYQAAQTLITVSNLAKDLEQLGDHQAAAALRAEVRHRRGQGEAAQVNEP